MDTRIASEIDKVANMLESLGLFKEAMELDIIANTIEKEAAYTPERFIDPKKGAIGYLMGRLNLLREEVKSDKPTDIETLRVIVDKSVALQNHFKTLEEGYRKKIDEYQYTFLTNAREEMDKLVSVAKRADLSNKQSLKALSDFSYPVQTLQKTWTQEVDNISNLTRGFPIVKNDGNMFTPNHAPKSAPDVARRSPSNGPSTDPKEVDIHDPETKKRLQEERRQRDLRVQQKEKANAPQSFNYNPGVPSGARWDTVAKGGLGAPTHRSATEEE